MNAAVAKRGEVMNYQSPSRARNQFAASAVLDLTMPPTGTYTITIKPSGLNLGSVNLKGVALLERRPTRPN